jgi:hypothetical protein
MVLVTGFEEVDEFRVRVGGCFLEAGVRLAFGPPSWIFVGIEEVLDIEAEAGASVADNSDSSTSFRFRFRTILFEFEAVAAFNFAIVGL